jgi:hypothetical protein
MSQPIKYTPGNQFHPQLNDELQRIKRALDNLQVLNGNVTIYSGQLAFVPNPLGGGEILRFVANTPTSKQDYLAWYESDNATRRAYLGFGNVNDEVLIIAGETATSSMSLQTNSRQRIGITAAGTVQVGQPDSGNEAMQVSGNTGGSALRVTPALNLTGLFIPVPSTQAQPAISIDASVGGATRAALQMIASGGNIQYLGTAASTNDLINGSVIGDFCLRATTQKLLLTGVSIQLVGPVNITGNVGFNNVTPQAASTGWGTPTGNSTLTNFPGATATLAQCSAAIAQLITQLKRYGLFGA